MRNLIFLAAVCFSGSVCAQQDPQYTMYWNNFSVYNPAATGTFSKHFAAINGRLQWVGFSGAPVTANFIYDRKLDAINGGVGVNYTHDQIGFITNNKVNINYSYLFNFKNDRILNVGISAGAFRIAIDGTHFIAIDPAENDPSIPKGGAETRFNSNFGAMYKSNHWLIGLSSTQLTAPYFKKLNVERERHYYLACMYRANLTTDWEIKPGMLLKSDGAIRQLDANLLFTYKKCIWLGLIYRPQDAVAFTGGVELKGRYRIGYAYDYITSALSQFSKGSHEVVLAYIIK